jgi:CMP-N-acetylneuraminic acid synthetase
MFDVVALMPMRHSSSRVKGKNFREFGDGRPLFFHMAEKLLSCDEIDKVVINTDSSMIKELCKKNFPEIILLDRPKSLCSEYCSMNDILLHDVRSIESKFYLQTHSTNPILSKNSLSNSINIFKKNFPSYDSLFSVTKKQTRYWDAMARPVNHNKNILMRTQDLPPIYEENSCIYIFDRECLEKKRNRIGDRPFLYETNYFESIDIDEEIDFSLAQEVFKIGIE